MDFLGVGPSRRCSLRNTLLSRQLALDLSAELVDGLPGAFKAELRCLRLPRFYVLDLLSQYLGKHGLLDWRCQLGKDGRQFQAFIPAPGRASIALATRQLRVKTAV